MLFVSLFMVIPQSASATSPLLIGAGVFSLAVIGPSLVAAGRSQTRTLRPYQLVLRFGSSVVAYMGVIVAGVMLGRGSEAAALSWLVAVTFILLVVSLRNSWDLLVSVGAATLENQAQQPESSR